MTAPSPRAAAPKPSDAVAFKWEDPFLFEDQLTEDERLIQDSARQYAQEKLLPRVQDAFRN